MVKKNLGAAFQVGTGRNTCSLVAQWHLYILSALTFRKFALKYYVCVWVPQTVPISRNGAFVMRSVFSVGYELNFYITVVPYVNSHVETVKYVINKNYST